MHGFENLEIYRKACQLRKDVFELVKGFPEEEKYLLTQQIIRSTRKCPAQIAEGYGRFHYQEYLQFLRIARGSISETKDHLNCALECEYISTESWRTYYTNCDELGKMINGFISYIKSKKENDQ